MDALDRANEKDDEFGEKDIRRAEVGDVDVLASSELRNCELRRASESETLKFTLVLYETDTFMYPAGDGMLVKEKDSKCDEDGEEACFPLLSAIIALESPIRPLDEIGCDPFNTRQPIASEDKFSLERANRVFNSQHGRILQ